MKIGVVDDFEYVVSDLSRAIESAGFVAVPVHVNPEQRVSVNEIIKKLTGVKMVLLDHYMGTQFTGADVAGRLPAGTLVVSTSTAASAMEYSKGWINKEDLNQKRRFDKAVEQIKKFAETVSNKT